MPPNLSAKKIYFVAGEASGDNHGAALMESLRALGADLSVAGRGGPQMAAQAGDSFTDWIADAAVVGLWEVIKKYRYFRRQFGAVLQEIAAASPDAVVLIDYPGFNLRLARALHRLGLTSKIIYYISPQVWAWNRGRIRQMARYLDLMLCIFPFEADLYNASGLRTRFVGHPMIDRLSPRLTGVTRDPQLVGLFPGSRRREVEKILPVLLETAQILRQRNPSLRFEISAASEELADQIQRSRTNLPISRDAASLMQRAWVGAVASGSATLEATFFGLPFALVYRVSWLTYLIGRAVVRVDYLGMPNLLADRAVAPEFIQHGAKPEAIAAALESLINDRAARETMLQAFHEIIGSLGKGGASVEAARVIMEELG